MPAPHSSGRKIIAAAIGGAAISVIATLLATGFFRQRDLSRSVANLEEQVVTAQQQARDETNRTRRASEQAAELINFFADSLRSELEPIGRSDILVSDARQAEEYFESLPPDATATSNDFHHAKILLMRAQAHYVQGALPESEAAFREAIALLEPVAGEDGDPLFQNLLAMTHNELALTLSQAGKLEKALAENRYALGIYEKLLGSEPESRDWLHGIASSKLGIAMLNEHAGDRPGAIQSFDRAIHFAERAIDPDNLDVHHLATLMFSHTNKGLCLMRDNLYDESEKECTAAIAIAEQLIELEPERKKWKKEYATLVNNFGSMFDEQGQAERARALVEKARNLRKELVSFDPNNGSWRYDLANSEFNIAMNFLERGEVAQAWGSAQQYLSHTSVMLRNEPGNEGWHSDFARYIDTITDRFSDFDAHTEAAKIFEFAGRLYSDLADAHPEENLHRMRRADALYGAGKSRKRSGDLESSLAHRESTMELRLGLFRENPADPDRRYELGSAIGNYAQGLAALDRYREALTHFQFAYATYLKIPPGHRSRDQYLNLDKKNIRSMRAKLGLIKEPPAIIKPRSVWKYWDTGEAPAPGWQSTSFDADAWKSGPGQLGYGDGDEKTKIQFGPDPDNKHSTAYFRHSFEAGTGSENDTLHINLIRDDGAIVYLNGEEVARDMMPEGETDFDTYATGFTSNDIENQPVWFDLPVSKKLRPGKNVIAVEIHQSDPDSSDLSFDLAFFKNAPMITPLENMNGEALKKLLAIPEADRP